MYRENAFPGWMGVNREMYCMSEPRPPSCRGYAVGFRWLRQSSACADHLVILPRYITVGCYEDAEHAVNHSRPNIRWIIVFEWKDLRNSWKLFFWQGWLPLPEDKLTQCPGRPQEAFRGRDSLPNRDWVVKDPVQPLRETYRQRNIAAYPLVGGCATRSLRTHNQFKFSEALLVEKSLIYAKCDNRYFRYEFRWPFHPHVSVNVWLLVK